MESCEFSYPKNGRLACSIMRFREGEGFFEFECLIVEADSMRHVDTKENCKVYKDYMFKNIVHKGFPKEE